MDYYECDNFMDLFFQMELRDEGAVIMQYYGEQRKVFLPDLYKGIPITAIGNSAFLNCRALEIIRLPSELKCFYPMAFGDCTALEKVMIPVSVASIADRAFGWCTALKSVWGTGIRYVGEKAFWNCDALEEAIFAKDVVLDRFSGIQYMEMEGEISGESMWFRKQQKS